MNVDKSSILFSKNLEKNTNDYGAKEIKDWAEYLGNSLIFGRSKIENFGRLKERLSRRLEG